MIEINNLTKIFKVKSTQKHTRYDFITAVDHINLNIKKGEIFGIIGPNGAGKTTISKILSTLIIPDEGTVFIKNLDVLKNPDNVKSTIGLLAGEYSRSLYWRLSGYRNLHFFAKLRGIKNPKKRINELFETLNLMDKKNELVMKYSTGMKHKLALAAGLLHDPEVLFLDEPLTGMDPVTAKEIKNLVKNKFSDKTIIWASHNLYEIEEMCDRIALLNHGKILLRGEPENLKKNSWDHTRIIIESDNSEFFSKYNAKIINNGLVEIKTRDVNKTVKEVIISAEKNNIKILDIKCIKPSLEEIFIEGVKKDV